MTARIEGINHDEAQSAMFDLILDEPVFVGRDFGQYLPHPVAAVMIADRP